MKKISNFLRQIPQFLWGVIWAKGLAMILWSILGVIALIVVVGFPIARMIESSPEEQAAYKAELAAVDLTKCEVYEKIELVKEDEGISRYKIKCKND